MSKIELKQTSIIINDYTLGDVPVLEEYFTQYDKVSHSYYIQGMEYNEEKKQLILPRGLDVYYLERLFNCKAVINNKYDPFELNEDINIRYLPRNKLQKEALRFMLGEGEYSNTKGSSQLSINLGTGEGKTYITIMTAMITGIRPIIIASNVEWIKQWIEKFLEYTDMDFKNIYILQGSTSITKILKDLEDARAYKVFLATHSSLKSYGDKYGWDKIEELFKKMYIGMKVFDEAHLNFDNLCKIDFHTNTYKTYYLTATPARSNKQENLVYQLYFKNVYSIDSTVKPRTHYVGIRFKSHPSVRELSSCQTYSYGLSRIKYTDYLVEKPNYYKLLHVIMNILIPIHGKVLIYIGTNNAIYKTREWLVENYPEFASDIGIFSSLVPKEERREQLNRRFILSTTKSAGAASDIEGLKAVVLLNEPFKSAVLAKQTLGRVRAFNTLYIEVVDDSFIDIRNYYNAKKSIFSKYALSCREINLINSLDEQSQTIIDSRASHRVLYRYCINRPNCN